MESTVPRFAFVGAFLVFVLGTVASGAVAASSVRPSLSLPRFPFFSVSAARVAAPLHLRVRAVPSIAPMPWTLANSWIDERLTRPGSALDFHYTVDNASGAAFQATLTASLGSALALGSANQPTTNLTVWLLPGHRVYSGTLRLPAFLQPGSYYLSISLQRNDGDTGASVTNGSSSVQVRR